MTVRCYCIDIMISFQYDLLLRLLINIIIIIIIIIEILEEKNAS